MPDFNDALTHSMLDAAGDHQSPDKLSAIAAISDPAVLELIEEALAEDADKSTEKTVTESVSHPAPRWSVQHRNS